MPDLYAVLYRPPQDMRQSLQPVADAFSPRYEIHRDDIVSIDVSGLERLLCPGRTIGKSPASTIADELRRDAESRGIFVHIAIAGTRTAAMVLAMAQPGVTIVERDLRFETPFGVSQPFKLLRLEGAIL